MGTDGDELVDVQADVLQAVQVEDAVVPLQEFQDGDLRNSSTTWWPVIPRWTL